MHAGADARVLVSAYAASPAHRNWDPGLEGDILSALCTLPDVDGLEVPWLGAIHPHDDAWFLDNVPAGARLSITALPYVMQRCGADPDYGIASPDAAGRAAALADLRLLAADATAINEKSEAHVTFVGLHTAPSGTAHASALAQSLTELADIDWGGAQLVIEHCDAVTPHRPFEKGFLSLADELDAIDVVAETGMSIGMWLNWGRSAIELRNADAVTGQIRDVAASGHLMGLTFSGAAATDGPYGAAWTDAHLPLLGADPESASLLDDTRVRAAITAAGAVPWLGVKVSRQPQDHTAAEVVDTVSRNLDLVRSARTTAVR